MTTTTDDIVATATGAMGRLIDDLGAVPPEPGRGGLPPLTGIIETADPETGEAELMGYWLPPGVTPAGIGIARGLAVDEIGGAP